MFSQFFTGRFWSFCRCRFGCDLIVFPLIYWSYFKVLFCLLKILLFFSRPVSFKASVSSCLFSSWDRINSLLLLTPLHKKIGMSSKFLAQKTISSFSLTLAGNGIFGARKGGGEGVDSDGFSQGSSFAALYPLMHQERRDFKASSAIAATLGLSSKMLVYAGFCFAVGYSPIPLEQWPAWAILAGPWWSSAFWVEWVCYDYFCSALAKEPYENPLPSRSDFISRWLPYEYHPEIQWAYRYNKRAFYFCTAFLVSVYVLTSHIRPPTSRILIKKMEEAAKSKADSVRQFMDEHPERVRYLRNWIRI